MKLEFLAWNDHVVSVITCCKSTETLCDPEMLQTTLNSVQSQFQIVNHDWGKFKDKLCAIHEEWVVCTTPEMSTSSVLVELRTLHQHRIQQFQTSWWHHAGLSAGGVVLSLMLLRVAGTKWTKSKWTKSA